MKSCCDHHGIECREGRDCPERLAAKVWCETSRQFCAKPYDCAGGCQIKAYNAELDPVYVWEPTPMGWAVIGCLVFWLFAAATFYFLGA